jgi:tRNA-specific 2-thiouridylase
MNKERILVGMSGGIDSTWVVKKLISEGFDVEGVVLDMHEMSPVASAKKAAEDLGIKLHVIDCRKEFCESVEKNLISEYSNARTPNPCVVCNSLIKFKKIAEKARELGIERISTGHYVRIEISEQTGRAQMLVAKDTKKDQSYFLWKVCQEDLKMFYGVICDSEKEDVKKDMAQSGVSHLSKESQEICFIPDDDRVTYLKSKMNDEEKRRAFSEGDFVDTCGRVLGKHKGVGYYTVGQRKGLGIALGRPSYVLELDSENNRVVLGFEEDNLCRGFCVDNLNFVSIPLLDSEMECYVRVRHRGALRKALVKPVDNKCDVILLEREKVVSPGQSAVFYDECGRVLFGGIIR